MLIDGRQVADGDIIETQVCIIGAGPAGMALALRLSGQPFDVCLLESGGFELDVEAQALNRGENVGRPYFPLSASRSRLFGGTSNLWAGLCRPLDEIDFQQRSWIPHSGWPFGKSTLDPYYRAAHELVRLGSYEYDDPGSVTTRAARPLPLDPDRIVTRLFRQRPTRFGTLYRDELVNAPNIRTFIFSNVLELFPRRESQVIEQARVSTFADNEFFVSAKVFVIACGGVENPRILLASRSVRSAGLGNDNNLVGRFFMENPQIQYAGTFMPVDSRFNGSFYTRHTPGELQVIGGLSVSDAEMRRHRMINFTAELEPEFPEHFEAARTSSGWRSLRAIGRDVRAKEMPDDFGRHIWNVITQLDRVGGAAYERLAASRLIRTYRVICGAEQVPNPSSRVTLSDQRDYFGVPRPRLDWRLTDLDVDSMRRSLELLAKEVGRAGVGRMQLPLGYEQPEWAQQIRGQWHHMGTTRMARDPKQGVVDEHCRVHSLGNLYVAGSSVFPTVGYANPTLTLLALAIRLGDRIKELLL